MIFKTKRIRCFALIINCTMIMKTNSRFSRHIYAISNRIWWNKHPRHTTTVKYDNNGKGGYFRFHDDNNMSLIRDDKSITLTLSQCTLAGPVYTGMPLECHWLIQCTLGYHWATQRILAAYTGTPLEKLSWNSPTLESHWRNLVDSAPYRDATGETLTFAAYTGTPLEGLWQPTHAPTHIVKHAE